MFFIAQLDRHEQISLFMETKPLSNGTSDPASQNAGLEIEDAQLLLSQLRELYTDVLHRGDAVFNNWSGSIKRSNFQPSARNLAHYLALREHDLRPIQAALIPWGLSSLGRSESRVLPNLEAVIATLEVICDGRAGTPKHPPLSAFFQGEHLLAENVVGLFGKQRTDRRIRILVTMPPDAADDYELIRDLVSAGMDAIRINCAHDTVDDWKSMIANLRRAEQEVGRNCKILMDLAGPKIRTGRIITPLPEARLYPGEKLLLNKAKKPAPNPEYRFQASCSAPEILSQVNVGAEVWIDDGKLSARIERVFHDAIELTILDAGPKGMKLKSGKGINFPKTTLALSPLSEKDYRDLDYVAEAADLIGYSFVQEVGDMELLQQALKARLEDRWNNKGIVAKIETERAIRNLPSLIVAAAGKQPFGVMIARGDLAVEIGYERLAEIQEEILWLCEAAHVPVVWATQVLETLVTTGTPTRAEMTDAAMSERAECVMLNKGPFVCQAVQILDHVLTRMQAHQLKKTPQLRALKVWRDATSTEADHNPGSADV